MPHNNLHLLKMIMMICLIIMSMIFAAVAISQKPLHKGWYSYKQLQRRGYTCPRFTGRVFIKPTSDTTLVNIKLIK